MWDCEKVVGAVKCTSWRLRAFNEAGGVVWLSGLLGFAVWGRFADLRLFAVASAALVAALIVLQGKTYYLANAVSVLIAGGAVVLEAWLRPRGLRIALMAAIVAMGLISAPFALPILRNSPPISVRSASCRTSNESTGISAW